MTSGIVKIAIADDHYIFTESLAGLFQRSEKYKVVGIAENGRKALELLAAISVDVLILDIDMPVMNGVKALKEIRKTNNTLKVLILSTHSNPRYINEMIKIGANGFLGKNTDYDTLTEAITTILNNEIYLDRQLNMTLDANLTGQTSPAESSIQISELTKRERQILELIAEGLTNKQIARRLVISHKTVEVHRTSLMKKLNVNNVNALLKVFYSSNS